MMRRPATRGGIDRRSFIAGAVAAAAVPWPAGANPAGAVTLRVSATPSIFKATFQRLSHDFQKRNRGIAIELTAAARNQDDQIQNTLRQSLIGDLPDVSFEGLNVLRTLQRRRIAVLLNDLIKNDAEWHDATYGRSLLENASVGQAIVGLATAISVPIIYYNAERLAKTSGSDPMPRQWDAILTLIDRLGKKVEQRFIAGYCRHAPGNWIYTALVRSHGGSLMSADESRSTFDTPPARRALEIYQAFGRAGQARANLGREQARQAFAAGGIGILVDSSSSLAMFEKQIAGRFKLGTAAIPVLPNGHIPPSGIASVLLTRNPSRQAAAWKFMKFVAGPAGQKIIAESTGYFPANDVTVRREDWLGSTRPLVAPIIESLPFTSRWNAFPGDNSAKIDDVIFDEIAAVITLSKTPQQAMAAMKHQVEALLPRNNA